MAITYVTKNLFKHPTLLLQSLSLLQSVQFVPVSHQVPPSLIKVVLSIQVANQAQEQAPARL